MYGVAWYGELIEKAKSAFCNCLEWNLTFTHREENGVAHVQAKYGLLFSQELVWIDEIPDVLHHYALSVFPK